MENLSGEGLDTLWFDVVVLPMTDITGTLHSIFDSTLMIPNATIKLFAIAPGSTAPDTTNLVAMNLPPIATWRFQLPV
jgi:hypothetical protein